MSGKKSGYKYQLEQELNNRKWIISKIGSNEDWWDDEHWLVEFEHDSTLQFYLCFIVDPMFEGNRKTGQGIYEIKASKEFPSNWNDGSSEITSLSMTKRKFDIKLKEFLESLEVYKRANNTDNN